MLKIVAMIPCRLGSQRIKKKNLRLLGGKVLAQWVAKACKKTNIFTDIYINSESEIFADIANQADVKFYKRPDALASNTASNDEFALDFMNSVDCDVLVQVNPTSPFTCASDILSVVELYTKDGCKTVHTVKNEQIEGLFNGKALNFNPSKPMPPSQELLPVQLFASSIMLWDCRAFRQNMDELGCAVYGGSNKIGYYPVKGFSALDIDNEEDFALAEAIVQIQQQEATYYEK